MSDASIPLLGRRGGGASGHGVATVGAPAQDVSSSSAGTGVTALPAGPQDAPLRPGATPAQGTAASARARQRWAKFRNSLPLMNVGGSLFYLLEPEGRSRTDSGASDDAASLDVSSVGGRSSGVASHASSSATRRSNAERTARVRLASRFIVDAMAGRNIRLTRSKTEPRKAMARHRISSFPLTWVLWGIILLHLSLVEWEQPAPHRPGPSGDTLAVVMWLELCCLVCYTAHIAVSMWAFSFKGLIEKKWQGAFCVIVVLCIVDWFISYVFKVDWFRFSRMLRPFLLIAKVKTSRRLLGTIVFTIYRMVDVGLLIIVILVAYSVLGMQLFSDTNVSGYSPGNDNYNSFGAAMLAMYTLTTTENFPTVMYPALDARPVSAVVYFVTFLFIILWVIIPLILAIVYDFYKEVHAERIVRKRVKLQKGLVAAYHVLQDSHAPLPFATFTLLIRHVQPRANYQHIKLMFKALDKDKTGVIHMWEFMSLPDVLDLQFTPLYRPRAGTMDRLGCRAYFRQFAFNVMVTSWFNWVILGAILGNTVTACWWTVGIQRKYTACMLASGECSEQPLLVVMWVTLAFSVFFCLEMAIKVSAQTVRGFWQSNWNKFDLIVVLWCTLSTLLLLFHPAWLADTIHPTVSDVLEASRAVRVLRVVSVFPRLRQFVSTLGDCTTLAFQLGLLYVLVTYSFAVIGMDAFSGVNQDVQCECSYQDYSFTSFRQAMLALFQITVGNNWNSVMYPNIDQVSGGRWWGWYFVVYYSFCTTLMANILTGLIIDAFDIAKSEARGSSSSSTPPTIAPAFSMGAAIDKRGELSSGGTRVMYRRKTRKWDSDLVQQDVSQMSGAERQELERAVRLMEEEVLNRFAFTDLSTAM